jgi:small subunit ribosomal protein S17
MAEDTTETTPRELKRKVREGIVASIKMEKTAVVEVTSRSRHPQYPKTVQRRSRYYVHDEDDTLNVGDRVRIVETRPLSKLKRWRLLEVLERAR